MPSGGGLLSVEQVIKGEADSPVALHSEDRVADESSPGAESGTDPEGNVKYEQGAGDRAGEET